MAEQHSGQAGGSLDKTRHEHIALHRLWVCAKLRDKLNIREHAHLVNCVDCLRAFESCLTGETFGRVLNELSGESA